MNKLIQQKENLIDKIERLKRLDNTQVLVSMLEHQLKETQKRLDRVVVNKEQG